MSVIFLQTIAVYTTLVTCIGFVRGQDSSNGQNELVPRPIQFPTKTGSQCFHVKGVPTLKLRCPGHELINVQSAFFGAPKTTVCKYNLTENHCIQLADLQENCMGRYMCSVYISNPFLMNCRTYASYMQVNYTCVPKAEIHDICQGLSVRTSRGFLRTPNYPDSNYTSSLHCACKLKTQSHQLSFLLHDFDLNHTKVGECNSDYLKISSWGKKCGHLGPERLPEKLEVGKREVLIEFKSDEQFQGRGFWLEFQGRGTSVTCGPVKRDDRTEESERTDSTVGGRRSGGGRDVRNENDLVLIDSQGRDTTLWKVKDEEVADKEPGEAFGNWVPHEEVTYAPTKTRGVGSTRSDNNNIHEKPSPDQAEDEADSDEDIYETYDFNETSQAFANSLSSVQMITGIVVGVLILIAVIIIIVLVFRK